MNNPMVTAVQNTSDHRAADFEALVPASSFEQGMPLVPDMARARVNELNRYLALYRGVMPGSVRVNYYRMVAISFADLILADPPQLEEAPHSAGFIESLQEAIYGAAIDCMRYGTGVIAVEDSEDGARATAPQPQAYYPLVDGGVALVAEEHDSTIVNIDMGGGVIERRVFERQVASGALGALRATETIRYGGDWGYLRRETIVRDSPYIAVQRQPATGEWGLSAYPDIECLVNEYASVLTSMGASVENHIHSPLVLTPSEGGLAHRGVGAPTGADRTLYDYYVNELDRRRKERVLRLPPGYEDARYLEWHGSLGDHFAYLQQLEDAILSLTSLHPALYGREDGGVLSPLSGRAISLSMIRSRSYLQRQQRALMRGIRSALIAGGLMEGIAPAAADVEIVWANLFDGDRQVDDSADVEVDEEVGGGDDELLQAE